ncbi:pectin acetylesterase 5-like [Henckelia pumila]|uniref:pectin acetylesterase 5-like n=1 Tax=Henckelia pumila TaxID=405737 RepID=UPI003C6E26D3
MRNNQNRLFRGGGAISLRWCPILSRRDWIIAAAVVAALGILYLSISPISVSRAFTNPSTNSSPASDWVPFTPLSKAGENSAVCLDGSVPGYHMERGFGSGSDSWLLHVEGGGWCNTLSSCSARMHTKLGSSNYMERQVQFSGILSHDPLQNPDFFNWNKVKIRYCDGASFSGNPESELKNGTKLFFRGQVIWNTLMHELLSSGMAKAKQALLTGCSAGGLATLVHCDDFRELLSKDTDVKCLADAGFFPNEKDISGNSTIESFYRDVVHLQGLAKSLNHDCVTRSEPHKCFFPQEFLRSLKTPIFLVQPAYDFWQATNILVPDAADPHGRWFRCKLNIFNCDPSQIDVLHGHRNSLLKMLGEYQQSPEVGMFVNSCFVHCQTWMTDTWHSPTSPRINNRTIAESVGDWYFKRDSVKRIDCPFPCNPTCYHMDFTRS